MRRVWDLRLRTGASSHVNAHLGDGARAQFADLFCRRARVAATRDLLSATRFLPKQDTFRLSLVKLVKETPTSTVTLRRTSARTSLRALRSEASKDEWAVIRTGHAHPWRTRGRVSARATGWGVWGALCRRRETRDTRVTVCAIYVTPRVGVGGRPAIPATHVPVGGKDGRQYIGTWKKALFRKKFL